MHKVVFWFTIKLHPTKRFELSVASPFAVSVLLIVVGPFSVVVFVTVMLDPTIRLQGVVMLLFTVRAPMIVTGLQNVA